jgi:hypothetical protein
MDKIEWIRDVIFLLPIAGIIWKGALMSAKIKENTKEIAECKSIIQKQNDVIQRQNDTIMNTLNAMTNAINDIRTDVSVMKALRDQEMATKRLRTKKAE